MLSFGGPSTLLCRCLKGAALRKPRTYSIIVRTAPIPSGRRGGRGAAASRGQRRRRVARGVAERAHGAVLREAAAAPVASAAAGREGTPFLARSAVGARAILAVPPFATAGRRRRARAGSPRRGAALGAGVAAAAPQRHERRRRVVPAPTGNLPPPPRERPAELYDLPADLDAPALERLELLLLGQG